MNLFLLLACATEPEPLPTAAAVAQAEAQMAQAAHPPVVQMLYDYSFLPEQQQAQQRVRIAIWLDWMSFDSTQLQMIAEARAVAVDQQARIDREMAAAVARSEPALTQAYADIESELRAGTPLTDPAMLAAAGPMAQERAHKELERELLALRLQGVQEVIAAEQPLLRSLTIEQEAHLSDALIFLRHRLDPYANPGDFNALVGTLFTPGDYATLTRGSFDPVADQWDLAGLWVEAEDREPGRPWFADLRRELILYLMLLEPALPEALEIAQSRVSAAPAPADPAQQAPGVPSEPAPVQPADPPPAAPGAPGGPAPETPPE
ncbi:MAG: hypothetical protein VX899_07365 [Myxococcota bacterium]|nr:hypothetical protein [Myxococcota bacterium]